MSALQFTAHIRARGEKAGDIKELGYKARRWVVERSHSWINHFRGLLIRWVKKAENYLSQLHLACGIICMANYRPTGIGSYYLNSRIPFPSHQFSHGIAED